MLSAIPRSARQAGDEFGEIARVAQRRAVPETDERRFESRQAAGGGAIAHGIGREDGRRLVDRWNLDLWSLVLGRWYLDAGAWLFG